MPTPVGHAIGGVAAALFTNSAARRPTLSPQVLLACAMAAMTPDVDLVLGSHRTYTHSVAGVAIAGVGAWLILRRRPRGSAPSIAIAAAYASHLFLDWLGADTSRPPGLMILWPFSSTYFISGLNMFGEVSRRYWRFDEFIVGNLMAVTWELFVLLPVLLIAWVFWSGRTVKTN